MIYILAQFSVTYGGGEQQRSWVSAFDVEAEKIVFQATGFVSPVDALREVCEQYPAAPIVSLNMMPANVKAAYERYNARGRAVITDNCKGW